MMSILSIKNYLTYLKKIKTLLMLMIIANVPTSIMSICRGTN